MPLADQIQQAAGCRHQYVDAPSHRIHLPPLPDATEDHGVGQ